MKNVRRVAAAALIAVFAVGAAGCNMITKTEAGIKKQVVAKFGNDKITKGELDERMTSVDDYFKKQFGENFLDDAEAKEQYRAQQTQTLDQMITEKIALKKAEEKKFTATEEEINKKIDEIKAQYKDEDIVNSGFKEGFNDPKFKENIKTGILLDKLVEDLNKDLKIEDSEIENYYRSNQLQFTEKPNTIHLAHILTKTEEDAKKAKERLDKGEDFAKVAKEMSTDTAANEQGGDLGEQPYVGGNFDQTFMAAALAVQDGKLSAPVQTKFGWHIIKVIKRTEYPVKKLEDVKEEIRTSLLENKKQTNVQDIISKWREEAKIEIIEEKL